MLFLLLAQPLKGCEHSGVFHYGIGVIWEDIAGFDLMY